MDLRATYRDAGVVTVVDIGGRITLGEGSALLRKTIRELLDEGRTKIVLNLADVNYIDSSGVASLVESLKASRDVGSRLILFGLSPIAHEVLQLSRLLKIFEIYDTEEKALEA